MTLAFSSLHRSQRFALGFWLTATLLTGILFTPTTQAQTINHVDAVFSLQYNNKVTDGENRLKIQRDQNQYHVTFALDHWMSQATQKADFIMKDCQVQPQHYSSNTKRPLNAAIEQRLDFNWQSKQAHYKDNDEQKSFDLQTTLYDPLSFFFEARCDLIAGKTKLSYPLIYKGKQKTHTYVVIGKEKVETGQGVVDALIVERQRSSKNRKTRLYVAPELDYLLVKIVHQESRLATVTATLQHMDYQVQ
ncbi:MAG TPA: DUF3108 domain-containing protein [Alcaligenaceae bacterium]|nr:DUF3108 domain-containing protein [Alcaligenaceae bacterium]